MDPGGYIVWSNTCQRFYKSILFKELVVDPKININVSNLTCCSRNMEISKWKRSHVCISPNPKVLAFIDHTTCTIQSKHSNIDQWTFNRHGKSEFYRITIY